jgi:hypothetical protein
LGELRESESDLPVDPPATDFPADLLLGVLADRGQEPQNARPSLPRVRRG